MIAWTRPTPKMIRYETVNVPPSRAPDAALPERARLISSRRRHTICDCDWSSDVCSTDLQEAVGEHKAYDYARVANPTRTALQLCLASLEEAEHGVAFSSGLGAVTTIMHLLNPGDREIGRASCRERV